VAISEIKFYLEELQGAEETLGALQKQLSEHAGASAALKRAGSARARAASSDLAGLPLEKLREMAAGLERDLQELKDEEAGLESKFYETNSPVKRARSRGSVRGGPSGSSNNGGGGSLTPEEEAWVAEAATLLSEDFDWGLSWDRRWQGRPMGPHDENVRRARREGTKTQVARVLGLQYFGETAWRAKKPQGGNVHVFIDRTPASRIGNASAGGVYLLGRYDVCVVKACADMDRDWNFIKGSKNNFWVAHAAALNIGESSRAADFPDFCRDANNADSSVPRLDDERYFEAMEHIMANVAQACTKLRIQHLIFFPFGMGAFLRHLGQLDQRFLAYEEMQRLRRRVARMFLKVLAEATPGATHVHLCLMFQDAETQCNADAFLRALVEPAGDASVARLRSRLTIYPEGDCLHLAHILAEKSDHVMLVNGANRALIGNHWFAGRARLAIDENLHRRSWRMSSMAYVLNGFDGREPWGRRPEDLQRNAQWAGGQIHHIDCCGRL